MASYTLPDTVHGGSITVQGNSLADAQQNAANATGASLAQQQGGGTFGINTNPSISGGGSPGGAAPTVQSSASQLSSGINSLLGAIASGNKQAFDEAVRQFNATFGLDQQKFQESVRQFNQNYAISEAGLTGLYNGQQTQQAQLQAANIAAQQAGLTGIFQGAPTLAAQQQAYQQQLGAIQAAAALQASPFRQAQVEGQLGRVLGGLPTAGFSAPNTVSGVGTVGGNTQGGLGYMSQLIDDIRDPTANQTAANSILNATPTPNKLDSTSFFQSTPGTQNLVLQAMQEKYGIDPNDALTQIKNTLPQFQAPATFGSVRR